MQNYREKTAGRQVLLVNDLAGYGKVALSAMIPVLSHMGHHIYNLPKALVSNTLDYGKFDILETTDYMRNTIRVWKELGFRFDAVILYDHEADEKQLLPFTSISVRFPGTGDIFSAVFMGKLLEGQTFADSTRKAMDAVSTLIDRNKDNEDKFKGIPLETCLEVNTLNIFRIERLEDEEQEEQDGS